MYFHFKKDCAEVIGVDIQEESVNIAKLNASENGIDNVQFFTGKAEEILLRQEFQKPKNTTDVVAIVNPPRVGLRKQSTRFLIYCYIKKLTHIHFYVPILDDKGILLLRKMKHLQRLVYISCDPEMALSHFLTLSRIKSRACQGAPFVPIKAVPVDLFPKIPNCELVVYFKR